MSTYISMLVALFIMLTVIKLVFSELQGRVAKKITNIKWYLQYTEKFAYGRTNSIIFMCVFCYLVASAQQIFTMIWVVELIGFLAVGVISDALSQFLSHYYIKFRFSKNIKEGVILKNEVKQALLEVDLEEPDTCEFNFDTYSEVSSYVRPDDHLAIVSVDGGEFVAKYPELPPITYVVEAKKEEADVNLKERGLKITTCTKDGKMPFKDDKMDVVINELSNYDKFEMFRVLKPGGYVIVDQMGSDNYKEIINMFIPFKMKGSWDKESCSQTLHDIGFEIVHGIEDHGYVRFKTMASVFHFIKNLSPERVEKYDLYINFYANILKTIKEQKFFDLTTHKFMVVAKKPEESEGV